MWVIFEDQSFSSVLIAFYSSLTWLQHMHGYEELIHVEFDGIWSKNGVKLSFRPAVLAIAGMF